MGQARWLQFAALGVVFFSSDLAQAKQRFVLSTGRRDPRIYAIDLDQALKAKNDNTPNAIASRSLGNPRRIAGTRQLRKGCPPFTVPFVSPTEPPQIPAGEAFLSDIDPEDFGCWPDPEGLALGKGSDGKTYLVSGNAGTEDVSIMDLGAALAGSRVVEVAPRITVQTGPFGIRASPNGKFVAVTARESNITGTEGNTISIIDVDLARQGKRGAEAARVQVGTDDQNGPARPFTVSWTPDGHSIIVANFRTNNVSIVDLNKALTNPAHAEIARIPLARADGAPARPKGTFVTADGRFAVVTGGANTLKAQGQTPTGTVFVIDLHKQAQVATVTKVGVDPYNLVIAEDVDD